MPVVRLWWNPNAPHLPRAELTHAANGWMDPMADRGPSCDFEKKCHSGPDPQLLLVESKHFAPDDLGVARLIGRRPICGKYGLPE
jgi:hypothetical protein